MTREERYEIEVGICNSLNAQAGRFRYSDPWLSDFLLRTQETIKKLLKENEMKDCSYAEQIVKLAVENHLVAEVYDILHYIVIAELGALQDKSDRVNSELRLIRKFANANKLDAIKDILSEEGDGNG